MYRTARKRTRTLFRKRIILCVADESVMYTMIPMGVIEYSFGMRRSMYEGNGVELINQLGPKGETYCFYQYRAATDQWVFALLTSRSSTCSLGHAFPFQT
jgi:hypothetical protein